MPPKKPVRLALVTLGCPKNLVDAERALGQMLTSPIVLVDDPRTADWILVNTCGFIDDAKTESIDTILQFSQLKNDNPSLRIAVAGCLSQRYGNDLRAQLPEIDFLTGILTRENVASLVEKLTSSRGDVPYGEDDDRQRLRITPPHIAYLRISEGCNNRCSYCAIPDIRGPLRSRPFENVLADAADLLADGAVEINVIAQDTCTYGTDLYDTPRLAELLREVALMNPSGWLRLLYAHPAHVTSDVIDLLADGYPVVPYLDLPLQHISDHILSSMDRKTTRARIEKIIASARAAVPSLYIRTAFIVGFPGETDSDFEELMDFIRDTRFERLGAFTYSQEDSTPAADFPDQIPDDEKDRRFDILMRTQADIARDFNSSLVGSLIPGIIDGPSGRDDLELSARTFGDAPEVDGTVFTAGPASPGDLVTFRITAVEDYDLIAEVLP